MADAAGKVWFGHPVWYLVNQAHIWRALEVIYHFFQGARCCYGNRERNTFKISNAKIV